MHPRENLNDGTPVAEIAAADARDQAMHPNSDVRERMKAMRDTVRWELNPALAEHGGDRESEEDQGSNTTSGVDRGAPYALRRLKRDRPDLAEEVLNGELSAGELSANAAAKLRTRDREACAHGSGRPRPVSKAVNTYPTRVTSVLYHTPEAKPHQRRNAGYGASHVLGMQDAVCGFPRIKALGSSVNRGQSRFLATAPDTSLRA